LSGGEMQTAITLGDPIGSVGGADWMHAE
jgi:hypothetical protein